MGGRGVTSSLWQEQSLPRMVVPADVKSIPTFLHLSLERSPNLDETVSLPATLLSEHPSLETVSIKRLKSVEKGSIYPYVGLTFIKGSIFEDTNNNQCDSDCEEHSGVFECVQMICQITKGNFFRPRRRTRLQQISDDGFLIFAYKTMEDMYNKDFAASWKTWTGARLLCQLLPEKFTVKRLSFFKKTGGCSSFAYLLIAQIQDMMTDAAPALNVLHCMRPKICAFVGAYRGVTFKIEAGLCKTLYLDEDEMIHAHTSHLRVNYSNHTATAEYPGYLEFRDSENGNGLVRESPRKAMVSEQTQTIPKVEDKSKRGRRTLPRTISIYDFPSMQRSPLCLSDHERTGLELLLSRTDEIREPMNLEWSDDRHGVIRHIDSPVGNWVRKSSRKHASVDLNSISVRRQRSASAQAPNCDYIPITNNGNLSSTYNAVPTNLMNRIYPTQNGNPIVSISQCEDDYPYRKTSYNSDSSRQWSNVLNALSELSKPQDQDSLSIPRQASRKTRRAHSNVATSREKKKLEREGDSLLRRLKETYFNSPEYTAEELRTADSD